MSFTTETEQNIQNKNNKIFLAVNVIHEWSKLTSNDYTQPTFSGVYNFDILLFNTYKIGMI